ncbi:unnamed protein product [Boreogadus saida]
MSYHHSEWDTQGSTHLLRAALTSPALRVQRNVVVSGLTVRGHARSAGDVIIPAFSSNSNSNAPVSPPEATVLKCSGLGKAGVGARGEERWGNGPFPDYGSKPNSNLLVMVKQRSELILAGRPLRTLFGCGPESHSFRSMH